MIKGFLLALTDTLYDIVYDLAIYECAVNKSSFFLAKTSINSNFSITILTIVVLSVDSYC